MTEFISVGRICEILDNEIKPIDRTERIALKDALGAVLAEDVEAPSDSPAFSNSAMDGYAFFSEELKTNASVKLLEVGSSYAGTPWLGKLGRAEAVKIMTGAPMPEGADTVIPFEKATATESGTGQKFIEFSSDAIKPLANVRLQGEEMRSGDVVMHSGVVLDPAWIGMAASLGRAALLVRKVRVAVFSTGDELCTPDTPSPLPDGHIYNANSPLLAAFVRSWGAEVVDLGILPDDPEVIRAALAKASAEADFIITSGGVGEGEHDYTTQVLAELGIAVNHYHVSQRPGKPFSFGQVFSKKVWFMALPGNPVAAAVSAHLYLKRALRLAAGALDFEPVRVRAEAKARIKGRTGRTDFVRGTISTVGAALCFEPASSQGSAMLSTLAGKNAMAVLPEDQASAESGQEVECVLL